MNSQLVSLRDKTFLSPTQTPSLGFFLELGPSSSSEVLSLKPGTQDFQSPLRPSTIQGRLRSALSLAFFFMFKTLLHRIQILPC
jgi:hypothetical protein